MVSRVIALNVRCAKKNPLIFHEVGTSIYCEINSYKVSILYHDHASIKFNLKINDYPAILAKVTSKNRPTNGSLARTWIIYAGGTPLVYNVAIFRGWKEKGTAEPRVSDKKEEKRWLTRRPSDSNYTIMQFVRSRAIKSLAFMAYAAEKLRDLPWGTVVDF